MKFGFVENMVHLDSVLPTSLGTCLKLFQMWELKTSLTEGSARRSQQTLTVLHGLTKFFWPPSPPTNPIYHQVVMALPLLFLPECPRHKPEGCLKQLQVDIDLLLRVS